MNTEATVWIWLAIILSLVFGHDAMYGPQAAYFSELFGTRVRYSGASLGYQLASVLAGGLSPLIATALLARYGFGAVAWYLAGMALITIVAVITAAETFRGDLIEERAEEPGLRPEAAARELARAVGKPLSGGVRREAPPPEGKRDRGEQQ